MKKTLAYSSLFIIIFLITAGGCAHRVKAIPDALKEGVLRVDFQELGRNPKAAIGKTVLLGGTIIETVNHKAGTRLEILQKPLDRYDRPLAGDESHGRFFIEQPEAFLDPAVYEKGRELTVVGKITEERVQHIGELEYRYPYIVVSHLHLWKKRAEYSAIRAYPLYYPRPYWYGPYPYYAYPYGDIYPFGDPFIPHRFRHHLHRNKSDAKK